MESQTAAKIYTQKSVKSTGTDETRQKASWLMVYWAFSDDLELILDLYFYQGFLIE